MIAAAELTLTALDHDDPQLLALVQKGITATGDLPRYLPTHWLGVKRCGYLLACVGIMPVTAGIRIDYLLFNGIAGFRQMLKLVDAIDAKFAGTDVFFNVRADNRLMRTLFESRGCVAEYIGYRRNAT
jgi:hypothetical protein